jgi:AraC-like DNA-binding protein
MQPMATIGIHYVANALHGAQRQGLDTDKLLQEVGIPPTWLSIPQARVRETQLTRLIQTIWLQLDDEFMGFTQQRSKYGTFALMVDLVHRCDTLHGLLSEGCRFYNTITEELNMTLGEESDADGDWVYLDITFEHQQTLDETCFYLEFWLVIWHRFACWYIGHPIPLHKATLTYSPSAYEDEFNLLFRCQYEPNSSHNRLYFNRKYLSERLIRNRAEIKQFLQRSPMDLMTIPGQDSSFTSKINNHLHQLPFNEWPTFDAIAKHLHTSPQTLRRKLRTEGTHFQTLKDNLRRDTAIEKLLKEKLTVDEIAELVGFTEGRSFTRAFQKWTGLSPSAYRTQDKNELKN